MGPLTTARLVSISLLSAALCGCGLGAAYEKTMDGYDLGDLYRTTDTPIGSLSAEVGSAHLMTVGDDGFYFLDPKNNKIFAYSALGAYVETIALPNPLDPTTFFHKSTSLGGGYDWYSRGFAYRGGSLYVLGFPTDKYLKYNLATKAWETVACKVQLPKGVIRDIRRCGDDGWLAVSSDYVIPHGYVNYAYSHLNVDFTLRHNDLTGDEGEFWSFGYQSSTSFGIYLLDTAQSHDLADTVFYELTDSRILFGFYSGAGRGYYVDNDRRLFSFTLQKL